MVVEWGRGEGKEGVGEVECMHGSRVEKKRGKRCRGKLDVCVIAEWWKAKERGEKEQKNAESMYDSCVEERKGTERGEKRRNWTYV